MQGYVATIGMFDGVHTGHRFVLQHVVEQARNRHLQSLCITFDHSPRREQVLTVLADKLHMIRQTGIDRCEVLEFSPRLKTMTARQFMEQVLLRQYGVRVLLTGYDNRFGHHREEGFADYVRYGRELGIEVQALPACGQASSSLIRQLLSAGNIAEANQWLGYDYRFSGTVAHGEHIGTTLGFPTANLVPCCQQQLIPAGGVYAVRVEWGDGQRSRGIMNIGTRPTFGSHPQTLEVHLLDYSGNLYGALLTVSFHSRLRAERTFDSPESLINQLRQDALQAQQLL